MSRLPREILWQDFDSMEDFLSDPLNRELYKVYQEVKTAPFRITIPDVQLFNELYYLCVSLVVKSVYDYELERVIYARFGRPYLSDLLIAMIYCVFYLQEERPAVFDGFEKYTDEYQKNKGWYFDYFYYFLENHHVRYHTDFTPRPLDAKELVKRKINWQKITDMRCSFDIKSILKFWPTQEERTLVLQSIENSLKEISNNKKSTLEVREAGGTVTEIWFCDRALSELQELNNTPNTADEATSDFASYVINKDKATAVLNLLHQYIDGKKQPQTATMPVRAAIDAKKLHKPTWEIYHKEFPNCKNSRTSFEKYAGASFNVTASFRGKDIYEEMVKVFMAI